MVAPVANNSVVGLVTPYSLWGSLKRVGVVVALIFAGSMLEAHAAIRPTACPAPVSKGLELSQAHQQTIQKVTAVRDPWICNKPVGYGLESPSGDVDLSGDYARRLACGDTQGQHLRGLALLHRQGELEIVYPKSGESFTLFSDKLLKKIGKEYFPGGAEVEPPKMLHVTSNECLYYTAAGILACKDKQAFESVQSTFEAQLEFGEDESFDAPRGHGPVLSNKV